jgi:hypothetical protein
VCCNRHGGGIAAVAAIAPAARCTRGRWRLCPQRRGSPRARRVWGRARAARPCAGDSSRRWSARDRATRVATSRPKRDVRSAVGSPVSCSRPAATSALGAPTARGAAHLILPLFVKCTATKGPLRRVFCWSSGAAGGACARRAVRLICAGWYRRTGFRLRARRLATGVTDRGSVAHRCVTDALARRARPRRPARPTSCRRG